MSRIKKSLINARVGVFFFLTSIFVQFFSRKIFLDYLGDEFIGLESTVRSILGFLNLAEMGIGTAIGFALYKPIFDDDRDEMNRIIALLGVLYKRIGYFIIAGSIITSLFFPLIFANTPFSLGLIYFVFYSFLFSSLLSYYVNYHQSLLGADQKAYVFQIPYQTINILRVILQAVVAVYLGNLYLFIALEVVFSIVFSVVLRKKIKREYPWLIIHSKQKAILIKEYPIVIKKIKQVFVHKMGRFAKSGTDNILVFALVNLQSVAFYGNYQLIFIKLSGLVKQLFAGTGSAVGNLIAEDDEQNIKKVFWELTAINFFIAGLLGIIIYYVMEPFIVLWLGEEYILTKSILILMIANFFVMQISSTIERFKNAYGLYSDTWAAAFEAILNLVLSYSLGRILGIEGIILGTLISSVLIAVIWKPYFVYKNGFKKSYWLYWKGILPIVIVMSFSLLLIDFVVGYFKYDMESSNLISWILYASKITVTCTAIYGLLLFVFIKGFKVFVFRVRDLVKKLAR